MTRYACCIRRDRGAELIELALGLPLLLLVLFGIFEFGFLFQRYEVITNAAREGARLSVTPGYSSTQVQNRVTGYVQAAGVPTTGGNPVTTVVACKIAAAGKEFSANKVTVTYNHSFSFLAPFAAMFGGSFTTINLRAVSTMRQETPAATGSLALPAC